MSKSTCTQAWEAEFRAIEPTEIWVQPYVPIVPVCLQRWVAESEDPAPPATHLQRLADQLAWYLQQSRTRDSVKQGEHRGLSPEVVLLPHMHTTTQACPHPSLYKMTAGRPAYCHHANRWLVCHAPGWLACLHLLRIPVLAVNEACTVMLIRTRAGFLLIPESAFWLLFLAHCEPGPGDLGLGNVPFLKDNFSIYPQSEWDNSWVEVIALRAWRPKFDSPRTHIKSQVCWCMLVISWVAEIGGSLGLGGQLA